MDELLDKYQAKFDDQFPLMLCRSKSDEDICKIIQQCLDDGSPYNPALDPEANY